MWQEMVFSSYCTRNNLFKILVSAEYKVHVRLGTTSSISTL